MQNLNINIDTRIKVIIGFIFFGALCRLIPHPYNFTPIAAMALFGGTYLNNKRLALIIPISAMLLSDLLLQFINQTGFHDQMFWVYASTAIITCIGFVLRKREQRQTIMVASLTGSIIFFVLTNFGTWASPAAYYPHTLNGLSTCYIAAIPFFKGTLMGDLFYNALFFGGFALARKFSPMLSEKAS